MFEAWTLRSDAVRANEEALREALRGLDDQRRAEFYRVYNRCLKDPDTYAVLNWAFLAGLHHFYLGRFVRGAVNLLIMVAGLLCLMAQPLVGLFLIAFIVLAELPALFRSQVIVADYNTKLGLSLLRESRAGALKPDAANKLQNRD